MKRISNLTTLLILAFSMLSINCCKEEAESLPQDDAQPGDYLVIYINSDETSSFWSPGGWMPDGNGIVYQDNFTENPKSPPECVKIEVTMAELNEGWAGIYWLSGDNWQGPGTNVYDKLNMDNTQSVKVVFEARGEEGGEKVQFLVGGVEDGHDSINPAIKTTWLELSTEWKEYKIDLSKKDLSNIVGGFGWVTSAVRNPGKEKITFYLDNIKYVVQ